MKKRKMGRTGLMVTPVSFGALPIQRCSMGEAKEVIAKVLDAKINFLDTARIYTDSEEKIGRYASTRRSEFYLATKSMARTREGMLKDIEASLKTMNTEYIDLYQAHNIKTEEDLAKILAEDGAIQALKEAKKAGKIGHIGVTGHIKKVVIEAVKTNEFDTVQFPFNCVEQGAADDLFPLAREMNVGIIVMKPLGGGLIRHSELALRFVLECEGVIAIPGMDKVEQIEANIAAGKNFTPLTPSERGVLEAEAAVLGPDFCRRCGYCLPCQVGINIPQIFIFYLQYSNYGMKHVIPQRYQKDLKVRASECIECGECEKRCPYELPIRKKLKLAAAALD